MTYGEMQLEYDAQKLTEHFLKDRKLMTVVAWFYLC